MIQNASVHNTHGTLTAYAILGTFLATGIAGLWIWTWNRMLTIRQSALAIGVGGYKPCTA